MNTPVSDRVGVDRDAYVRPERAALFFDPWLTTRSLYAKEVAHQVAIFIFEHETRKRKRRPADKANFETILHTVTANLAYAILAGFDPPRIAVPLAKASGKLTRYDRRGIRQLPKMLEHLSSFGFLTLTKSRSYGFASTIEPTPLFIDGLANLRRQSRDPHFGSDAETIILSLNQRDDDDNKKHSIPIDYRDDDPAAADTARFRQEMATINDHLAGANLSYDEPGADKIDTIKRRLRRRFIIPSDSEEGTIRFDLGGRLFGGFWQQLSAEKRRFLKIEGEPIADLDYSGMFVRLAYLHPRVDKRPSPGDPYAMPGFKDHREGIKRVLNAMFFRQGRLKRLPRGTPALLPPNTTAESVRSAILKKHPALESVFETAIGHELFFTESSILVDILLRLREVKIYALPMHDGVMVPSSKAETTMHVMEEISREHLNGYALPVTRKA